MNNESQLGWIKLYRKLLHSPIFSSEKGLKVWVWCMLKATHEGYDQYVGRTLVTLKPGEFIFGRDSASKELRMKPSTVWGWIKQLKTDTYIDINSNSKYSVLSIKNWEEYQGLDSKLNNKKTTDGQQMDTNKNDKNVKNKYIYIEDLTDSVLADISKEYSINLKTVTEKKLDMQIWLDEQPSRYLIKGKRRNLKMSLMNWIRRDMKTGNIKKITTTTAIQVPELSEEQRLENQKHIAEIKSRYTHAN